MMEQSDDAVSPVIGVVLMVAITVILAAVIATFVFGMATNMPTTRTVAVTVESPDADHLVIVYKGGPDASSFNYGIVAITPSKGAAITNWANTTSHGAPASQQFILGNKIGNAVIGTSATPGQFSGKDHVIVVAKLNDGSSQVVLDSYI